VFVVPPTSAGRNEYGTSSIDSANADERSFSNVNPIVGAPSAQPGPAEIQNVPLPSSSSIVAAMPRAAVQNPTSARSAAQSFQSAHCREPGRAR